MLRNEAKFFPGVEFGICTREGNARSESVYGASNGGSKRTARKRPRFATRKSAAPYCEIVTSPTALVVRWVLLVASSQAGAESMGRYWSPSSSDTDPWGGAAVAVRVIGPIRSKAGTTANHGMILNRVMALFSWVHRGRSWGT